MGNITRDLELRHTSKGTAVCSFSVATNRRYRVEDDWREDTEFHNVVIWANQAEQLVQRASKGTRIYIEGRLQTRNWENDAGEQRYTTEIVANRAILIDRYEKGPSNEVDAGSSNSAPPPPDDSDNASKQPKNSTKNTSSGNEEKIDPDDLPF